MGELDSLFYVRKRARLVICEDGEERWFRGAPVGCLAFSTGVTDNGDELISFGWSVCSTQDTFTKRAARKIARARLAKHPVVFVGDTGGYHQVVISICQFIRDHRTCWLPHDAPFHEAAEVYRFPDRFVRLLRRAQLKLGLEQNEWLVRREQMARERAAF
jgi:hypothetical protein